MILRGNVDCTLDVTQYGMSSKVWHDGLGDDSEPLSGWQTGA